LVIEKVYCCAMVHGEDGWVVMPSYRNQQTKEVGAKKHKPFVKCPGKFSRTFLETNFYFFPYGLQGHSCLLLHGRFPGKEDNCPPLLTITVAPGWGVMDERSA
jgi:hypothetical protein